MQVSNRTALVIAFSLVFTGLSCGGSSDSGLGASGGKDAGIGGSGGSGGPSGGSGGSTGGAAGSAGTTGGFGGSTGGSAGSTGGAAGASPVTCDPPSDPGKAALCVLLQPETVSFIDADSALDGKGVLIVQVFDTAKPDLPGGGTVPPLATTIEPAQPTDAGITEGKLQDLVSQPFRFDGLPAGSVFVRAIFADDSSVLKSGSPLKGGTWLAGIDLSNGFVTDTLISAVPLAPGQGNGLVMPLIALRRLTVSVSRAPNAVPVGNGQGQLSVLVTHSTTVTKTTKIFGVGRQACADLSGLGPVSVTGVVLAGAPAYVTGVLDDLGGPSGDLPPGSIAALESSGGQLSIPAGNLLPLGATDYAVSTSIELGFVVPAPDAGADSVSCN